MKDLRTKIGITLLFFVLLCVMMITAYKYFYIKNYIVDIPVHCDWLTESCFASSGDFSLPEPLGAYKIIVLSAEDLPVCTEKFCPDLVCEGQSYCEYINCTEENAAEYTEYESCIIKS